MNCEYCNKEFTTKSNLNYHQKSAKYCLELREKNNEELNLKKFQCDYCETLFLRKTHLQRHIETCKDKDIVKYQKEFKEQKENYEKIILEQKEQYNINFIKQKEDYESQILKLEQKIEDLQNKNQELALRAIDRPSNTTSITANKSDTITNANTYNHLQPINLSYDHLYKVLDQNLKLEHIYQGQVGLANVVANKLLTDENGKFLAFCNDKSRQIIKYKNENNELIKDVKAFNLVSSIAPVAEEIAIKRKKEFEKEYLNNKREIEEVSSDEDKEIDLPRLRKEAMEKGEVPFLLDVNGDFIGFEDEFDEAILRLEKEKNREKKKEGVEKVIKTITEQENWDEDKKTYYLTKLVKGITDLQILNLNPTIFSKQLSMILPSDVKNISIEK